MALREERSLSAPIVFIDGRRMKVIPKSVSNEIPGSAKVRAVSAGGGDVEMVFGIDLEDMVCAIKFKLPNTAEYAEFAKDVAARRQSGDRSTIRIVEDTIQDVYDQCTCVNKISIPREPEGEIELEYMGRYLAA
jgi:hypothetical protein